MDGTKPDPIDAPPVVFNLAAHLNGWFSWARMTKCFWPRYSGFHTSKKADAELAPMVDAGGIYLLADSGQHAPESLHPSEPAVIYIGETSRFKRRMGQFGDSAGLWDDGLRTPGHSAGARVKLQRDTLWLAFFPVKAPRNQSHLGTGLRRWLEAIALEEHRLANGALPTVNAGEEAVERAKEAAEPEHGDENLSDHAPVIVEP